MSENGRLVSVVVGFLNGEKFIEEAVDGVLAQTHVAWELWLVDDGSTDASTTIARDYARKHPGRISYLEHPGHQNRGVCASRNLALRHAAGQYIALLDVDDVWLPDKLERQVALMEVHPEAGMVFGASQYWRGWTGVAEDLARDYVPDLGVQAGRLYRPPSLLSLLHPLGPGTAPSPSDLLLRRELVERIGGFEEGFRGMYQLYEDQAFLTKVYLDAPVYVSDETWDRYRIHPDSCMAVVARAGQNEAVRQFYFDWLEGYLRRHGTTDPAIWQSFRQARRSSGPSEDSTEGAQWSLRTAGGSAARLDFPPDDPDGVRIAIEKAVTGTGYDIQLNMLHLAVLSQQEYRLEFRARADQPRSALVGVAEAHEPWAGLGWHQTIELTPAWQGFRYDFVAPRDEPNARIHFDVGDSAIPVDLAGVSLRRLPDGEPVSPESRPSPTAVDFGSLRRLEPVSRRWGFERGLPVDRYYVEAFLAGQAEDVRGRVLEIEDRAYTRRFGADRVTTSDVLHVVEGNPRATLVGDLTRADHLHSDAFDCIILTQTLQFIYDTRAALRTLHRILKPGGALLATFPGLTRIDHTEWTDSWFWSFTTASARRLFEEVFPPRNVRVQAYGNVLTATAFLQGLAAEDLLGEELDHLDPDYEVLVAVRAVKARSA